MRIAAETFALTPVADGEGQTSVFGKIKKIYGPLKSTLLLLDDGTLRICPVTSHFLGVQYYHFSNILRKTVCETLGIPFDHVLVMGSHSHTSAALTRESRVMGRPDVDLFLADTDWTADGLYFKREVARVARELPARLVPAEVRWGVGRERRITYHHKGRRSDGTTYMIREDDRLAPGGDYTGDIEDTAPVVAFTTADGSPLAFLVQFTGHPTTAYHPDYAIVFGEYPQLACDDLSAAHGGVPVAFVQGCAADSMSKGSFTGRPADELVAESTRLGHCLGATYLQTAKTLRPSKRTHLSIEWEWVALPFEPPPAEATLRSDLAEIQRFLERCERNDEQTTLECLGLNFSKTFSCRHRAVLVNPLRLWTEWVLRFYMENRLDEAPTHVVTPVTAVRIGDVGLAGLACEPFMGIGRLIREGSPLPLTLPCGYANDTSLVNIPDAANNGDMEFNSSTYRHTTRMLKYAHPAGDLLIASAPSAASQTFAFTLCVWPSLALRRAFRKSRERSRPQPRDQQEEQTAEKSGTAPTLAFLDHPYCRLRRKFFGTLFAQRPSRNSFYQNALRCPSPDISRVAR